MFSTLIAKLLVIFNNRCDRFRPSQRCNYFESSPKCRLTAYFLPLSSLVLPQTRRLRPRVKYLCKRRMFSGAFVQQPHFSIIVVYMDFSVLVFVFIRNICRFQV